MWMRFASGVAAALLVWSTSTLTFSPMLPWTFTCRSCFISSCGNLLCRPPVPRFWLLKLEVPPRVSVSPQFYDAAVGIEADLVVAGVGGVEDPLEQPAGGIARGRAGLLSGRSGARVLRRLQRLVRRRDGARGPRGQGRQGEDHGEQRE